MLRTEHPVFHQPIEARVELTPLPSDDPFFHSYPKDTPTWLVQTGDLGSGKGNDYGVVSDGIGFEDSPDCEWISGGINSKGPHGLAIGREANLLQWGFYAAPDRMTPSAQRVFLNALVYMCQFDGQRPLVAKRASSRDWLDRYVATLEARGDQLSDASRQYYLSQFPSAAGTDVARLGDWLRDHREFLRGEQRKMLVDADLLELGISNRKPEFLDWLETTLAATPDDARALRLAARYLGPPAKDAASTLAWLRTHRERLFFSDVGGYRWFVDTRPQ